MVLAPCRDELHGFRSIRPRLVAAGGHRCVAALRTGRRLPTEVPPVGRSESGSGATATFPQGTQSLAGLHAVGSPVRGRVATGHILAVGRSARYRRRTAPFPLDGRISAAFCGGRVGDGTFLWLHQRSLSVGQRCGGRTDILAAFHGALSGGSLFRFAVLRFPGLLPFERLHPCLDVRLGQFRAAVTGVFTALSAFLGGLLPLFGLAKTVKTAFFPNVVIYHESA